VLTLQLGRTNLGGGAPAHSTLTGVKKIHPWSTAGMGKGHIRGARVSVVPCGRPALPLSMGRWSVVSTMILVRLTYNLFVRLFTTAWFMAITVRPWVAGALTRDLSSELVFACTSRCGCHPFLTASIGLPLGPSPAKFVF